jgi:hypothetical protein
LSASLTLAAAGHMGLLADHAGIRHERVRRIAGCSRPGRNPAGAGRRSVTAGEGNQVVGNRSGHSHLAEEGMGYVTVAGTAGCTGAHRTGLRCTDRKGQTL